MTSSTDPTDCPCLEHGPKAPQAIPERYVGCDETDGRYADVTLTRCSRCRRLWLGYAVEYEGFSNSGRWCEAVIDDATAATMTPEAAPGFLAAAPWHVYGGSYFGHAGKRGSGAMRWGLA
jgi:hypothetical protein